MIPDRMKHAIGWKRYVQIRELVDGNRLYNRAYDRYRTIFVHIPKSAGTSVGEVLFPGYRTTHYSWNCYQSYSPERFEQYFKFTFVRNPFDRLVSAYVYLEQGGKSATARDRRFYDRHLRRYESFGEFVRSGLQQPEVRRWGHFEPQSKFVASDDGTIQVDFVGRVERMEQDFQVVADRLGIQAKLAHVNATKRDHYAEYYDAETAQIVRNHYAVDFELFGYPDSVDAKQG